MLNVFNQSNLNSRFQRYHPLCSTRPLSPPWGPAVSHRNQEVWPNKSPPAHPHSVYGSCLAGSIHRHSCRRRTDHKIDRDQGNSAAITSHLLILPYLLPIWLYAPYIWESNQEPCTSLDRELQRPWWRIWWLCLVSMSLGSNWWSHSHFRLDYSISLWRAASECWPPNKCGFLVFLDFISWSYSASWLIHKSMILYTFFWAC